MVKIFKRPSQQVSDEYLDIIKDFAEFITTKLPFKSEVQIYFIKRNEREGCSTGQYDPQEDKIYAVTDGRALVDIMRTVAHEMVHMKQKGMNQIDPAKYTDIGGFAEGEANVKAGNFIKMYVKEKGQEKIYDI
jgi:hypothetical protein